MIQVKIKILTPIRTGNEHRKYDTLRETGLIGSLRWWYEALIRGLGGSACDPTSSKCDRKNHCDACELFGCTGWARKFRLEVQNENNDKMILKFVELRPIKDIEWALLNKTLKIIEEHGAMGGKIAEPNYGLIKIEQNDLEKYAIENYKTELNRYFKRNGGNIEGPNITRFVFAHQILDYNIIKGLKNSLSFLKGKLGKGKRYFYKNGKPHRLFVYAENDDEYKQILEFFKNKGFQFIEGKRVLMNDTQL